MFEETVQEKVPPCISEHDACTLSEPCPSKERYKYGASKSLSIKWLAARCKMLVQDE